MTTIIGLDLGEFNSAACTFFEPRRNVTTYTVASSFR